MGIKLVALDMDGTLLDSRKKLPAYFMGWVEAHPGIKVVIASGRRNTQKDKVFPMSGILLKCKSLS